MLLISLVLVSSKRILKYGNPETNKKYVVLNIFSESKAFKFEKRKTDFIEKSPSELELQRHQSKNRVKNFYLKKKRLLND